MSHSKNRVQNQYVLYVLGFEKFICGRISIIAFSLRKNVSKYNSHQVPTVSVRVTFICTVHRSLNQFCSFYNELLLIVDLSIYSCFLLVELDLTEPTKTHFATLFDVFAFFANPRIMHKPMLRTHQLDSIIESIGNAFGDSVSINWVDCINSNQVV